MTRAHGAPGIELHLVGCSQATHLLRILGLFVVADAGIAIRGNVTLSLFVIPIQLARLFPLGNLVRSIAERLCAGESTTAKVFGFAADGHRIGTVGPPVPRYFIFYSDFKYSISSLFS